MTAETGKKAGIFTNLLLSIRTKAAAAAVALVLALVAVIGSIVLRHERLALTREVEMRVLAQARSIAASSERTMLEPAPELTFQKLLREMMSRDQDIQSVVVVEADGTILAHPQITKIGTKYSPDTDLTPVPGLTFLEPEETLVENEDDFLVSAPITRTYEGRVLNIGRVYIRSSKGKIVRAIGSAQFQITSIAIIVSLLGSVVAVILAGFITKPIKKLAEGARRIGEGNLSVRVRVKGRDEIGQLSTTLNEMAARLETARRELVEKERMARELEIARELQRSLLPGELPQNESVDVAAACESATEVGGDYYDIILIDEKRLGVIIADVSGKGVPGLFVMGVARSVLRAQSRLHLSPRDVLSRANETIAPDIHRGMFVTALYGVLDIERRTFVYSNAGHNPIIIIKHDGPEPLEILKMQGRPLGFMTGAFFDDRLVETTVQLGEGDIIFAYTDGVLDAMNEREHEFGMARLKATLARKRGARAQAVIDAVLAELAKFVGSQPQHDDITMLAISVRAPATPGDIPPAAEPAAAAEGSG